MDGATGAADSLRGTGLRDGVSVVVPSHRGRAHIGPLLGSIAAQTLSRDRYDVIVILNGEPDGTYRILDGFNRRHPDVSLRVLEIPPANVSAARNAGLRAANRRFVTFVDDDDTVSPWYLATLLEHATPGVVPFAMLIDVDEDGLIEPDNRISRAVIRRAGGTVHPTDAPEAVGFNACKLLPTEQARQIRYDEDLHHGGEDLVYFLAFLARNDFMLRVCPVDSGPVARNAVYYRTLRPGSISRQPPSFAFNVAGRLDVIARLDGLYATTASRLHPLIRRTVHAQATFINRYLRHRPEDLTSVLNQVRRRNLREFPYEIVTRDLARSLVVSYCFPPYADTSGIVMAKRVRERSEVVDVVYNAMDRVRGIDDTAALVVRGMIDRQMRVDAPTSFARWAAVEEFCLRGLALLQRRVGHRPPYERLYSRVNWPASHFLAALYKLRNPSVRWSAEFSDPVSHGIDGKERRLSVSAGPVVDELSRGLHARGLPLPGTDNGFRWCEEIAFALADEVVFTNPHQMEYMLGYCADGELARLVRSKAVVQPHPSLPPEFYTWAPSAYRLDENMVNLGYFGTFYATRGLDDILRAMSDMPPGHRDRLRLHVFTGNSEVLSARVRELGLTALVAVRPYVPYLEFLHLATRFDCLIVNDAVTSATHPMNPYLPSKWSDYRGSGTAVWGLVERGSVLSHQPLRYATPVGDVAAAVEVLTTLARDDRSAPLANGWPVRPRRPEQGSRELQNMPDVQARAGALPATSEA